MAFLTLFRIATGDNWNGIMKDTLRDDCDNSEDCVKNCCVNIIIAPIFFVVFVLMAQFVLVNVVVAVLMKHLEESNQNIDDETEDGDSLGLREVMKRCEKVPGIQNRRRSKLLRPYKHLSSLSVLEEKTETSSLIQQPSPCFRRKKHSSLPSYLDSPPGTFNSNRDVSSVGIIQADVEVHCPKKPSFKGQKDVRGQPRLNFSSISIPQQQLKIVKRNKDFSEPSFIAPSSGGEHTPETQTLDHTGQRLKIGRRLSFQLPVQCCTNYPKRDHSLQDIPGRRTPTELVIPTFQTGNIETPSPHPPTSHKHLPISNSKSLPPSFQPPPPYPASNLCHTGESSISASSFCYFLPKSSRTHCGSGPTEIVPSNISSGQNLWSTGCLIPEVVDTGSLHPLTMSSSSPSSLSSSSVNASTGKLKRIQNKNRSRSHANEIIPLTAEEDAHQIDKVTFDHGNSGNKIEIFPRTFQN